MQSKPMTESADNNSVDWQDRALHYGDGLFETLLLYRGEMPFWSRHFQRLTDGCQRLSIKAPDSDYLRSRIEQESAGHKDAVIKIIVSRGIGGRGIELPPENRASIFVFCYPGLPSPFSENRISICRHRLPMNPALAGIKHLNRLDYVMASLELQQKPECTEALLCDQDGFLVEGIVSNLFFVDAGRVRTPTLKFAGVAGIMRQIVIDVLSDQGISVETGRFPLEALSTASEIFICNSARGIGAVIDIDGQHYPAGELTQRLMKNLNPIPNR